jgi:hypothetical protein
VKSCVNLHVIVTRNAPHLSEASPLLASNLRLERHN